MDRGDVHLEEKGLLLISTSVMRIVPASNTTCTTPLRGAAQAHLSNPHHVLQAFPPPFLFYTHANGSVRQYSSSRCLTQSGTDESKVPAWRDFVILICVRVLHEQHNQHNTQVEEHSNVNTTRPWFDTQPVIFSFGAGLSELIKS